MSNDWQEIFKKITVVIVAKNEARMLPDCLALLRAFPNILVIDNDSSDETNAIAKRFGATVVTAKSKDFSKLRNIGLKLAQTQWLFYLDADERLSPKLTQELAQIISADMAVVAGGPRLNYFYGHKFKAGGWENDRVTRLFKKEALRGWSGEIHESPIFEGAKISWKNPLIHLTHRSTAENLLKSASWTKMEAKLLVDSGTIPMVNKRVILRKGMMEFYRRYWKFKGHRDGMAGFVESLVQAMNKMMVYIQVWELQLEPSLKERYQKIENNLEESWRKIGLTEIDTSEKDIIHSELKKITDKK